MSARSFPASSPLSPRSTGAASASGSPEARWVALFGSEPPRSASLLAQALAWKEQVLAGSDVSPAVRHDLALAAEQVREERVTSGVEDAQPVASATGPGMPPASSQLQPGTRLVKSHGGKTHVVEVTAGGMLYEGQVYASLSAVAKVITGTHWNGLLFFGLRKRRVYPAKAAASG